MHEVPLKIGEETGLVRRLLLWNCDTAYCPGAGYPVEAVAPVGNDPAEV
jgi:hypothetical protein